MERAAVSAPALPVVAFHDGLGERRHVVDPTGHEAIDVLCLRGELSTVPSFEFALRERVSHLAQFRHAYYGRVRGVERLGDRDATLAIVSDATPGVRLSDILALVEERRIPLDINAALCLIRQLVPAVAILHESARDVAHGALGPERLIVTPTARLMIVEYVAGAALEQLRYSRERYWTELRVPLPRTAGLSRFDQRADVTQIGAVALSLILGRLLRDEEYPSRVADLVASAWAVSSRGGLEPLPAGLRAWLGRALQLDARQAFLSAVEAREALDTVLGDSEYIASPASLEQCLARYHDAVASASPDAATPAAQPALAPMSAARPASPVGVALASPAPVSSAPVGRVSPLPDVAVAPRPVQPPPFGPPEDGHDGPDVAATALEGGHYVPEMPDALADLRAPVEPRRSSRWPIWAGVAALLVIGTGGFVARRSMSGAPAVAATGTLIVTTNPSGATLAVDGEPRGETPITLTLAAGSHTIELRGDGEPRTIPVTITAGAAATQYIELPSAQSAGGQLQVRTDPPGAQVTVDGVTRGVSPITVADLTPGEHAVLLTTPTASSRQTVLVERGAAASLVVTLSTTDGATSSGWISISAPIAVQLFENGVLLGTSATDQIMVSSGRHDIEVVNEALGYRATHTVQVPAGKVARLPIELPKGTLALNAIPWAEVWIDGEKIGETPIGNLPLSVGPHDVVFRHPELGEQHQTATVTLKGGGRLSVDLRKK